MEITSHPTPQWKDSEGAVRIGQARVSLDTVIHSFRMGATPEEIVYQFPSLQLVDVYATISFYLSHVEAVDAYLKDREAAAKCIRDD